MIGNQHRHSRLTIDPVVQTSPRSLPDATSGELYTYQLTAVGLLPNETVDWVTKYGTSLPDGLTISSTGMISGIPTALNVGINTFCVGVDHEPA